MNPTEPSAYATFTPPGWALFGAALTLPGIAGIVLTVGMAVDANILIFERIREELRNGTSPWAAINGGFEHALSAIIDANVTTLIAGIALLVFGSWASASRRSAACPRWC